MDDALTIEHEGKKYIRDHRLIACVSTDLHERITWRQASDGEPPKRALYLSGSAKLEASTFLMVESPDSRADAMSLSIVAAGPDDLMKLRRVIDLHSEGSIGDPKPGTMEHAWTVMVGYITPYPELGRREHDWFCVIDVPEGEFEQLREDAKQSTRLEIKVQVPTYREETDLHFGGNERTIFFPRTAASGRCTDMAFAGADSPAAVDPDDPSSLPGLLSRIDGRLETISGQLKGIRKTLLVLAGAAIVSAMALYLR